MGTRRVLSSLAAAVACGLVVVLAACTDSTEDAASERGYNPALSGAERVVLVSEWAQERNLLTGEEMVAALGESTAEVVDAASPDVWMNEWAFHGPVPDDEVVMDAEAVYVLHREGDSRAVITYVSESLTRGPAVGEAYANVEEGERRRNTSSELYDPAAIGVDAFAYETNGGSGALDRMVVVNTGNALVVVVASPASPDAPEADLTESENLTREQVDSLVRAAVEKLR